MHIINKYLTSLLLLFSLTACDSIKTIVADFELDGNISLISSTGETLETAQFSHLKRNPSHLSPFPELLYEGRLLKVRLNINSVFAELIFTNKQSQTIVLRLDEATLSSNFINNEVNLLSYSAHVTNHPYPRGKVEHGTLSTVPRLTLPGWQQGQARMVVAYREIYPNQRLFNVKFQDKQEILLDTGIGNRLSMRIPIEYEGKREILLLQLQPKAVNVRTSYH